MHDFVGAVRGPCLSARTLVQVPTSGSLSLTRVHELRRSNSRDVCGCHPLVRKGIAWILANEADIELVAEAANGQQAVEKFHRLHPDVVLLDLRMPQMDRTQATRAIRKEDPGARIIALTSYGGGQDIYRALGGRRARLPPERDGSHGSRADGFPVSNCFVLLLSMFTCAEELHGHEDHAWRFREIVHGVPLGARRERETARGSHGDSRNDDRRARKNVPGRGTRDQPR